jgi:hypothetical protein
MAVSYDKETIKKVTSIGTLVSNAELSQMGFANQAQPLVGQRLHDDILLSEMGFANQAQPLLGGRNARIVLDLPHSEATGFRVNDVSFRSIIMAASATMTWFTLPSGKSVLVYGGDLSGDFMQCPEPKPISLISPVRTSHFWPGFIH